MQQISLLRTGTKKLGKAPSSLLALLAIVTIIGCAWALLVPPWQSPDENRHFAYVQTLAENGALPGAAGKQTFSSDQSLADLTVGATDGEFDPDIVPPSWSKSSWHAYLNFVAEHPPPASNGGGPNPAENYPPLFYAFDAVPYLLDHGGTIFGQLYEMRIWNVLLLDMTALGGWLLAGEVFRRRQPLQLTVGAICALMPMSTFMSTSVNPDALLITLWTLTLWLGARVIRRRAPTRDTAALCAVMACAILTKPTSYALIFPLLAALGAAWRLTPAPERRATLVREVKALPWLVIPALAWLVYARVSGFSLGNNVSVVTTGSVYTGSHTATVGGFLQYLWEFYLPRLPFMSPARTVGGVPAYTLWLYQGTGQFGWLSVSLPAWVYSLVERLAPLIATGVLGIVVADNSRRARLLIFDVTAAAVIALAVAGESGYTTAICALVIMALVVRAVTLSISWRPWTERHAMLVFLTAAVFGLLLLLHASDYLYNAYRLSDFVQGRYLMPGVSVFGLGVALIMAKVPVRLQPTAGGLTLAALLGLQFVSLAAVLHAYYL